MKRFSDWLNPKNQFQIVDDKVVEYQSLVVHRFNVPGEDVAIESAEYLWQWENSEAGKWVMDHAVEVPIWHKTEDFASYMVKVIIVAKMTAKDATFWQLKWGNTLT